MATLASTIRESVGSLTLHKFNLTSVATTETFASGLGANVVGFWANAVADEATDGNEGVNVSNSSGTFTFSLKTTGTLDLYVLSKT